jgi:hypothetical protein
LNFFSLSKWTCFPYYSITIGTLFSLTVLLLNVVSSKSEWTKLSPTTTASPYVLLPCLQCLNAYTTHYSEIYPLWKRDPSSISEFVRRL